MINIEKYIAEHIRWSKVKEISRGECENWFAILKNNTWHTIKVTLI